MATLPKATTRVEDTAGVAVGGLDLICVCAPVGTNADIRPRLFGSAAALHEQHGYSEGLEYCAEHAKRTGKGFLFVGLPIADEGVIGRVDQTGNTGTSNVSVTAGVGGILHEHDGAVMVVQGGTVGSSQIKLGISLDGTRIVKNVRLGTANTFALPYVNGTLNFGAGTLVAGDIVLTWHASGPRADGDGWNAARVALAAQQKLFRSMLIVGDLQSHTEASIVVDLANTYEVTNERFIYVRVSTTDRLPQAAMTREIARMTGSPQLTFLEVGGTGDTITRSSGSWIADRFAVGDVATVAGSAGNNVTGVIAALTATVLTFGTTDLANEGPVSNCAVTAAPGLTFAAAGHTITRSRGSWVDDGFAAGDAPTIAGTASNNVTAPAATVVTALVLTFGSGMVNEGPISSAAVTITAGQTKAAWMADLEDEYEPIADQFRIDISAGRGRTSGVSAFSGWKYRRPAGWFASWREYQHDLHVATWRKGDGPVDADLKDDEGNLVEWDDFVDGGAGSAARFTTLRSWANGPEGAFIAQSLTRGDEGSLTSKTHNVAVINLAQSVTQLNTEDAAIGVSLILNDDGTATSDSLARVAKKVNDAEEAALLQDTRGEGPRASQATWTPDPNTIFNVPEPLMLGTLDLNLNGTVHSVLTAVRVRTGGA